MTIQLLEIEKAYLEQLDIIDTLQREWIEQEEIEDLDFSQMIDNIQKIHQFHQDFYKKVETERDKDDLLLYLVKGIEEIYTVYCQQYVYNLSQNIHCMMSIQRCFHKSSLESLLNAPLRQLNIYKSYFNETSTSHSFKSKSNQLFDSLMNSVIDLSSIDTYHAIDIITQEPVNHYQLGPTSKILLNHPFNCIELKKNIQVLLTKQCLILCANNQLLFPSLPVNRVHVRSVEEDQLELLVDQKMSFTLKAKSKEQVSIWSLTCSWAPLEQSILAQTRPKPIKTTDLFSFYYDPAGEISPIESSDDEEVSYSTTSSDLMQTSTCPPPPLPKHSKVLDKDLPRTPPEKKSSFMRSVLSLGPRSRKSQLPESSQSAVSLDSSCSSSQSSLATPPMSRSCSPAVVNRFQTEEDESTPPTSPDMQLHNKIKQLLYENDQCQVFHWKDESWYAANECILQVRQTHGQRSCVAVHLKETGEMYLNAWILPTLSIQRISETDINLTVQTTQEENYLFHCITSDEADKLDKVLQHQLANQTICASHDDASDSSLFQLAMECKCKLYLQSSSSKWSSFGSVRMKVSQHSKSKRMHMAVESGKDDKVQLLVSSMVQSRNVERLGPKQISFLFTNEKTSMVYMVKVREELIGDKILEYLKEKNTEQGW